jgi:hypothetical protein
MEKIFDATLIILLSSASHKHGGPVFTRLFLDHPRSVGESYLEHQRHASGFGIALLGAGLACLVHALVPGLFVRTGSDAIARLHDRMIVHRTARRDGRTVPLRT